MQTSPESLIRGDFYNPFEVMCRCWRITSFYMPDAFAFYTTSPQSSWIVFHKTNRITPGMQFGRSDAIG